MKLFKVPLASWIGVKHQPGGAEIRRARQIEHLNGSGIIEAAQDSPYAAFAFIAWGFGGENPSE
jgi:hypothetical protein